MGFAAFVKSFNGLHREEYFWSNSFVQSKKKFKSYESFDLVCLCIIEVVVHAK